MLCRWRRPVIKVTLPRQLCTQGQAWVPTGRPNPAGIALSGNLCCFALEANPARPSGLTAT